MKRIRTSCGVEPPRDDSGNWTYEPFQDADGSWRCGASCGSRHESLPCLKRGQIGHPGHRCKFHKGGPTIHGMRSKYGPGAGLLERIDAKRLDPELMDCRLHLAGILAVQERAMAKIAALLESGEPGYDQLLEITRRLAAIGDQYSKIAERQDRIVNGIKVELLQEGQQQLGERFERVLVKYRGQKLTDEVIADMVAGMRGGSAAA